jgi:DivIVA domain-containing protein
MGSDDGATDGHAAMISRIQNARFNTTWRGGYDEEDVDKFLDFLVQIFSDGYSLHPQIVRKAAFQVAWLRPGYKQADVDAFLDEVELYASGHR